MPIITQAERLLARELRRIRIPFTQSASLFGYEFDFLLPNGVLVEVDGWVHVRPDVAHKDLLKETTVNAKGFVVLRFTCLEAHNDPKRCARLVQELVAERAGRYRPQQYADEWKSKLAALRLQLTTP